MQETEFRLARASRTSSEKSFGARTLHSDSRNKTWGGMRSLFTFFAVVYVVSWSLFAAGAAIAARAGPSPSGLLFVGGAVTLLGVIMPSLVALALTARGEGRAGALGLLRPTVQGSVGAQWYAFAIGYFAAIKLSAALLDRLATGAWPRFGQTPLIVMAGAILLSTPVQAGGGKGGRGVGASPPAGGVGRAGGAAAPRGSFGGAGFCASFFLGAEHTVVMFLA